MKNSDSQTIVVQRNPKRTRSQKEAVSVPSARGSTSLSHVVMRFLFIGTLVFLAWVIHNWMVHSNAFLLQTIDIHGNRIVTKEEIQSQIQIAKGVRLTDVELSKIEARLRLNPFIRSVVVSRRFPSTLDVEIEERVPIAHISGRKKMWMLDEDAVLLPALKGSRALDLPVIVGMKDFTEKAAEKILDQKILQAVWLLSTTRVVDQNLFYRIDNVTFSKSRGIVVYLTTPPVPLYFGKDLDVRQIEYVRTILNKLKRERRLASTHYIDLRFEQQVVVG